MMMRLPYITFVLRDFSLGDAGMGRPRRDFAAPPFHPVPTQAHREERLYFSTGERFEVSVYDSTQTPSRVYRWAAKRRPVSPELRDDYRDRLLNTSDPDMRLLNERFLNAMPIPDSLPATRELRVDRTGALWVRHYRATSDTVDTWSVLAETGTWLADIDLPVNLRVTDIGVDYVLGVRRDDTDVEHVVMYRLRRR